MVNYQDLNNYLKENKDDKQRLKATLKAFEKIQDIINHERYQNITIDCYYLKLLLKNFIERI